MIANDGWQVSRKPKPPKLIPFNAKEQQSPPWRKLPASHSVVHYPMLMIIGAVLERRLNGLEARLIAQLHLHHGSPVQGPYH